MEYRDAVNHVIPTGEFRGKTVGEALRSERGIREIDKLAQGGVEGGSESQAAFERVLKDGGVHRELLRTEEKRVDGRDYIEGLGKD